MTALGILAALIAALFIGYAIGYRRASRTLTWRQRTSRVALGRQAVGLIALVAASQLQRTARRRLPVVDRLPSRFGR